MKGLSVEIIGHDCAGTNSPTYHKTRAILRVEGCEIFDSTPESPPMCLVYGDPERVEGGGLNVAGGYTVNGEGKLTPWNSTKGGSAHIVRVRAVPIDPITGEAMLFGMFSGQYLTTSDSRFPCHAPIPCHSRFEVER